MRCPSALPRIPRGVRRARKSFRRSSWLANSQANPSSLVSFVASSGSRSNLGKQSRLASRCLGMTWQSGTPSSSDGGSRRAISPSTLPARARSTRVL